MLLVGLGVAACSGAPKGAASRDAGSPGVDGADALEAGPADAGSPEAGDASGDGDASPQLDAPPEDAPPEVEAASSDGGDAAPAAGCGMPPPASSLPATRNGYLQFGIMTTGATPAGPQPAKAGPRAYWVRTPATYDPHRSYRTVFETGFCEGLGVQPVTLALYGAANPAGDDAIYVIVGAPQDAGPTSCYDTSSGAASSEFEAFALVHDDVAAHYCVDEDRVFVVSHGQSVSDQLGCYFGGAADPSRAIGKALHVRGQALYTGEGEPAMLPKCDGPVAAIWFDDEGAAPPEQSSQASMTRVTVQDGCGGQGVRPWGNFPCEQAVGCPAGYPVILCQKIFGRVDPDALAVSMFEAFMEAASPPSP
jgi:hypothetical protein